MCVCPAVCPAGTLADSLLSVLSLHDADQHVPLLLSFHSHLFVIIFSFFLNESVGATITLSSWERTSGTCCTLNFVVDYLHVSTILCLRSHCLFTGWTDH